MKVSERNKNGTFKKGHLFLNGAERGWFKKKQLPWNKGKHIQNNNALEVWRENGGEAWNKGLCVQTNTGRTHFKKGQNKGEKSWRWKGDNVGYTALHSWVRRWLGSPTKCEICGKDDLIGKQINWANKDHSYERDLADWIRLCRRCHKKYDIEFNLNR